MINNLTLEKLYYDANKQFNLYKTSETATENDLLSIIKLLIIDNKFTICRSGDYYFYEISNLLRFYEDELKSSFLENKTIFNIIFNCYVLLIKLFIRLCSIFSFDIYKRAFINEFLQILKESKNILKFYIPLEINHVMTLNHLIGKQLYNCSHIQYIKTKNKELNYIFEEYFLNLENQVYGYELSLSSNFGNNKYLKKDIEHMIFINNSYFLLLKMIFKLTYYIEKVNYFDNTKFREILKLFSKISISNKNIHITDINKFKMLLIQNFKSSSTYLMTTNKNDILNEKIKLLKLNIDEYKQLIDIIILIK
jgi:hypothetical protein